MKRLLLVLVMVMVSVTIYCQRVLRYSLDEMYYGRIEYGEIVWTDYVSVDYKMTINNNRIKIGKDVYDIIIQTCKEESEDYGKLGYYVKHKKSGYGYYVTFMFDKHYRVYIESIKNIIGYNINLVD